MGTTREQAVTALRHVEKVYGRFGFRADSETGEHLVELLLAGKSSADEFRNTLWGIVGGGGASAGATRAVYGELDRLDETNPNWI